MKLEHSDLKNHIGKLVSFEYYRRGEWNKCEEALIYSYNDAFYLLQNEALGMSPVEDDWKELGYKYTWIIIPTPLDYRNIELINTEETVSNYEI